MSSRFATNQGSTTSRFALSSSQNNGSRFAVGSRPQPEPTNLSLENLAQSSGVTPEPEKKKLSFLQRLSAGLGGFETGNAVYRGIKEKSVGKALGSYVTGVFKGIGSAITGRDFGQTEKKSFRDVLQDYGNVDNKILKNGLGIVGDILLDPTTYFGGFLAKGATKGAGVVGGKALTTLGKFAPDAEKGLRLAGTGLKDAFGKSVVFGYGSSKGVANKALEIESDLMKARKEIIEYNNKKFSALSPSQREELVDRMLAGKNAELAARKAPGVKVNDYQITAGGSKVKVNNYQKGAKFTKGANGKFTGSETIPGTIARSVVQIVDTKTGEKFFKELDEFEYAQYLDLIDNGRKAAGKTEGIAGKNLGGKVYHITAKSASEMIERGFKEADFAIPGIKPNPDALVDLTIKEQIARNKQFAKLAGVENPYEVYFPSLKKDKLQKTIAGINPFKVGSEGYRKEYKNLIADDELIKDPAEAFAKREWQVTKDAKVRDELNTMVKDSGLPFDSFKNAEEARQAGYVMVKEKGQLGKEIGWMKEADKRVIDSVLGFDDTYAAVDTIAKYTGFDLVTNLFKRSVTGLFAPFHVRNYVGGMVQNFEVLGPKVFSPATIAQAQQGALAIARGTDVTSLVRVGSKNYKMSELLEPFSKRFETSSQYIEDFQEATTKNLITTTAQKFNPLSQENYAFKGARAVGNFIETQQKLNAYLTALKSGRTTAQALDYAARAGFDYRALTSFESKVLRRVIPFYSFTRKNIELQLSVLGENPQRINQIINFFEGVSNVTEDVRDSLPDYAKEQFVFRFGGTDDVPEIAVGAGTPIEALGQLFGTNPIQEVASILNPLFKVPLERAMNKDFFRDRPLDEVIEAGEYSRAPQYIKDFLEVKEVKTTDKDGNEKIKYNADPYKLQLLRNLPTTRGAGYLSAITNEDTSGFSRILNAVTGVKPRPIDLETVEYFRTKERQGELEELLIQSGVMKKFEKAYVPKN